MDNTRHDAEDIAEGTPLSGDDELVDRIELALAEAHDEGHGDGHKEGHEEGTDEALVGVVAALSAELEIEVQLNSTDDLGASVDKIIEAVTIAVEIGQQDTDENERDSAQGNEDKDMSTNDGNNGNDNTPFTLTAVANIADARKAKAAKAEENEESPLKAYPPGSELLQDDQWLIRACDGFHEYIWIARKKTKKSKKYSVTEIYPGLTKKRTLLRDAKEPKDLELAPCPEFATMSGVLEELDAIVFEDFEDDEAQGE